MNIKQQERRKVLAKSLASKNIKTMTKAEKDFFKRVWAK